MFRMAFALKKSYINMRDLTLKTNIVYYDFLWEGAVVFILFVVERYFEVVSSNN